MGGFANFFGSAEQAPFSYEKQRTEEESTTRPDALTRQMNRLKTEQTRGMLEATGGYKKLFGPGTDKLFQLTGQSQNLLNRFINQARQPGLTPEQWYRSAQRAIDPTTQIAAAQDVLRQIITPQVQQRYAEMGLGRSGALGEGLTMAGSQIALPIASMLQQQRFALETQRPNVDATLRAQQLQRIQQGFAASDVQRQLDVANWQRKTQGTASALSMVPYVAGQQFKGTSRQFGNLMWDLLQTAIGVVGAMRGSSYSDPTQTTPAQMNSPGLTPYEGQLQGGGGGGGAVPGIPPSQAYGGTSFGGFGMGSNVPSFAIV